MLLILHKVRDMAAAVVYGTNQAFLKACPSETSHLSPRKHHACTRHSSGLRADICNLCHNKLGKTLPRGSYAPGPGTSDAVTYVRIQY